MRKIWCRAGVERFFRNSFLAFCAIAFCCAETAEANAENSGGNSGAKSSLLSRIRRNHRSSAVSERDSDFYLIVKSPDGRGSAFLVRLWDQPVIVTNAHVFLSMKNPEIVDINGRKYVPKEVLASKTRDLVIISYEGAEQESRELLTAIGDAGAIPINTKVTAYGNSLGDDVIVSQKGKLLGIGPDKIEVDAAFVPGNSGGPVVLDEGGEVIGVSTYLRFLKPNRATIGSQYEVSLMTQQVRRFATRIDNIDPADLEPVFLEKLDIERELVRKSSDWISDVIAVCSKKNITVYDYEALRNDCIERSNLLVTGRAVNWSNSYLRNEFEKNRKSIEVILSALKLNFLADLSRINAVLERHVDELSWKRVRKRQVRCFSCTGSGKYSIKRENPDYTPQSAGPRWIIERHSCPVCSGTGRRVLWPDLICFSTPKAVIDEIGLCIQPEEGEFFGFTLGGVKQQELNRFPFYRKAPLYRIPNAFGETLLFTGNHENPRAVSTALTFMFDRLVCVEVVTPGIQEIRRGDSSRTFVDRVSEGRSAGVEIPDNVSFDVRVVRIQDRKMIPVDLRGKPLLKPIPPQEMEDDPSYDGFIARAVHPSLMAINMLDLESLAQKTREARNR